MTTALIIVDETTRTTGSDDDLDHLFCCCSPGVAICGADISEQEECPDDVEQDNPCVVCHDLMAVVCTRCGFGFSGPCWCGACG